MSSLAMLKSARTASCSWAGAMVDIWLPDCKYRSAELAARYSRAADYPETVKTALAEMVRQTGAPLFDRRGMMKKGVIVRHLVLPGCVSDSKDVLEYLWDTFGNQIYVSIMSQYTPCGRAGQYHEINRRVTKREYEKVLSYICNKEFENVYIKEKTSSDKKFIPPFDLAGV